MSGQEDLSNFSMHELFRIETEGQAAVLSDGLLALENDPGSPGTLESLMRAAHSIKGAARIIGLDEAVGVAHSMEDCFVAAQSGEVTLGPSDIDLLLRGVDMMSRISVVAEDDWKVWLAEHGPEIEALKRDITAISRKGAGKPEAHEEHPAAGAPLIEEKAAAVATVDAVEGEAAAGADISTEPAQLKETAAPPGPAQADSAPRASQVTEQPPAIEAEGDVTDAPGASAPEAMAAEGAAGRERTLRISPEQIDRLLALAGEVQIKWKWLRPFGDSMLQIKRQLSALEAGLEKIGETRSDGLGGGAVATLVEEARSKAAQCAAMFTERLSELDAHDRAIFELSQRLYHHTVSSRMQPFAAGVHGFKRMVRDLARGLGKQVRLEIVGADTLVDRDILEKIEAPLNHLLRNAVDHAIEAPDERAALGKAAEGVVTLEAVHHSGMLKISVADDGRGVDLDAIRGRVVERGLSTEAMTREMSETELLAFLFLPRFTMKDSVSEISGRGVGLDVVASAVNEVRGLIRTSSQPGRGTRFELHLPITLSVLRSLLVEIAGEPYAFPLARIERVLRIEHDEIEYVEGRQYITINDHNVGLVPAGQVLGLKHKPAAGGGLNVVVLGTGQSSYGIMVDRLLGECDLVEKVLDPRLGKVRDIGAGALMDDGYPVLIIDVSDMIRSIERIVSEGTIALADSHETDGRQRSVKRILVVDDSITVREVERKLLAARGYEVEVAVDGMDGWNSLRSGNFNLVISDVDMPRMDGIDLVRNIKGDPGLKETPVVIVSYKESDEDRMRGLEAGADSYLTKSSFHDDTLIEVVADLIGEA